ncbi:hypothetical protein AAF712_005994 [Marasmius tenuissimus]|uniref:Uncharacterized protein n=1 Tax=Marasmius tenuissimus TaxID=585030 RepID=A0ABR2ZZ83_9AGAR
MSAPNRFAKAPSLWALHDAPNMQRPASFDEHQHLAFEHLARAQFLFSTLVKDYPDHVPSPLRTLVKDVLQEIPLEIQAIQPYMTKLLYRMLYTARAKPVKVVECMNPGAPASSPIVAERGGTELEVIEQLHIPESNQFSLEAEGRPFTLTQTKTNPLRPLIDLPFVVKFTPDSNTSLEQTPVAIQIGYPEHQKATIAASVESISRATTTITAASSALSPGATIEEAPDRVAPSTSVSTPLTPLSTDARVHFSSLPRSVITAKAKQSTSHVWQNPGWQELVRRLPHLRYTLTPPPESKLASIPPDVLPGNEHLPQPPSPRKGRPLKRENAFYGSSNPQIFWDKSWGPKPFRDPIVAITGDSDEPRHSRAIPSPSLNFGSSFRSGEERPEMDGAPVTAGPRAGTEPGGGRDGSGNGDVGGPDTGLPPAETLGATCSQELNAPLTPNSSLREVSYSSSPGSVNLRGTLRRGLKVAYKAFGLEGKKSL